MSNEDVLGGFKNDIIEEDKRALAEEVRRWIDVTDGDWFTLKELQDELHFVTKKDRTNSRVVVCRLHKENKLERHPRTKACYRQLQTEKIIIEWWNATIEPLDIDLPFGLHDMVDVDNGTIIVCAGQPQSGKTETAIELVNLNLEKDWLQPEGDNKKIQIMQNELSAARIHKRLLKHEGVDTEEWKKKVDFVSRDDRYDHILIPKGLNVIDYIDAGTEPYVMGAHLRAVHNRIRDIGGTVWVNIQKHQPISARDTGVGGEVTREVPVLYIAMGIRDSKKADEGMVKIVKAKSPKLEAGLMDGMKMDYAITDSGAIISTRRWYT